LRRSGCKNKSNLPNVEAQQKAKGQTLKTKATHFVRAIKNRNRLMPHRPPKERNEKIELVEIAAGNGGKCLTKNFINRKLPNQNLLER
jgi:alanine racemase